MTEPEIRRLITEIQAELSELAKVATKKRSPNAQLRFFVVTQT